MLIHLSCNSKSRKSGHSPSNVQSGNITEVEMREGGNIQQDSPSDNREGSTNSEIEGFSDDPETLEPNENDLRNEKSEEIPLELNCSIVPADAEAGTMPTDLPTSYQKNCYSCHNDGINAVLPFPALNTLDYQTFTSITRTGRGQMPAFSDASISGVDLEWSYKFIKGESFKVVCEERQAVPISAEEYSQKAQLGLLAWRSLDATKTNQSCANCHGPDPVEFAFFNYTTADLLRRGLEHVSQKTVMEVAQWVEGMRSYYQIIPKDRDEYRPLQPGGKVLGPPVIDNPYQIDNHPAPARDFSFGEYLQSRFLFAKEPINDVSKAEAAEAELLEINLRDLPIGIPFNRWTEDKFRGEEHANFAEWIPSLDCMANEDDRKRYFEASDAYLQNPGLNQLVPLLEQAKQSMKGNLYNVLKCRSVQLASHFMRMEAFGIEGERLTDPELPRSLFGLDNSAIGLNAIWEVGRVARDRGAGYPVALERNFIPPEYYENLNNTNDEIVKYVWAQQRCAWFYGAWMMDPTHMTFAEDLITEMGEYFSWSCLHDLGGYPIHTAFISLMTNLTRLENPESRSLSSTRINGITYRYPYSQQELGIDRPDYAFGVYNGLYPSAINFNEGKNLEPHNGDIMPFIGENENPGGLFGGNALYKSYYKSIGCNTPHGDLYARVTSNFYKIFLLKIEKSIDNNPNPQGPKTEYKQNLTKRIGQARSFFSYTCVNDANGIAIADRLDSVVASW